MEQYKIFASTLKAQANAIRTQLVKYYPSKQYSWITPSNFAAEILSIPNEDATTVKQFLLERGSLQRLYAYQSTDWLQFNDTTGITNFDGLYESSHIYYPKLIDTSSATSMRLTFAYNNDLRSVPALDVRNVTDFYDIFRSAYQVYEIKMYGMKASFDISPSTKFTREALVQILNNLAIVETSQTLTMGSTNLAKLTDEDKLIATNKGWVLA